MISVVCVYNNDDILNDVLLPSLRAQTADYQEILVDNRAGRYPSAASALNAGCVEARGDYVMFVHQDVWLGSPGWLVRVEAMLDGLGADFGAAGVAGISTEGRHWIERIRYSILNVADSFSRTVDCPQVEAPEEVQTLDECLLLISTELFRRFHVDEQTFDAWDCYGADLCLTLKREGLKNYVLPSETSHCCRRAYLRPWQFAGLRKYHKRLYRKHKRHLGRIYTWMGNISAPALILREIMSLFGPLIDRLAPDMYPALRRAMKGCDSTLDLGCGGHSPLMICDFKESTGVDLSAEAIAYSRRLMIHDDYIHKDVRLLDLENNSYHAVVLLNLLHLLDRDDALRLLDRAETWAVERVVVWIPGYGRVGRDAGGHETASMWSSRDFKERGYSVFGLGGAHRLVSHDRMKKRAPAVWQGLKILSQAIAYRAPTFAEDLFAVKRIGRSE